MKYYFAQAELFEHAYSSASYTSASVVSMLSGLHPARHGIRSIRLRGCEPVTGLVAISATYLQAVYSHDNPLKRPS